MEGVRPYYKRLCKKAALNGVSKVLGCNPGKLGLTYAAVTASYNLTYEVLNAVLPAGKAKTPYYLMHYIATFEKGLSQTVRSYGTTLEILKIPMLQMPTRARKITIWLLICSEPRINISTSVLIISAPIIMLKTNWFMRLHTK